MQVFKEKARFNYTGHGWEGVNYKGQSTKEIAKEIRQRLRKNFLNVNFL